jgi:hypothetical protein
MTYDSSVWRQREKFQSISLSEPAIQIRPGLGQDISPLFRAADRSRPNLRTGSMFGVETFR